LHDEQRVLSIQNLSARKMKMDELTKRELTVQNKREVELMFLESSGGQLIHVLRKERNTNRGREESFFARLRETFPAK
jgi:hypothetical protein